MGGLVGWCGGGVEVGTGDAIGAGGDGGLSCGTVTGFSNPLFVIVYLFVFPENNYFVSILSEKETTLVPAGNLT